jgi:hypothetical protein
MRTLSLDAIARETPLWSAAGVFGPATLPAPPIRFREPLVLPRVRISPTNSPDEPEMGIVSQEEQALQPICFVQNATRNPFSFKKSSVGCCSRRGRRPSPLM